MAPTLLHRCPTHLLGEPGPQSGNNMAIDQKLRERVDKEIGEFNAAFDAALSSQNAQALEELARAADRLMRVIGRVLIEVKRPP